MGKSYERDKNEGRAWERRRQIIDSLEFQKKRESKKAPGQRYCLKDFTSDDIRLAVEEIIEDYKYGNKSIYFIRIDNA